MLKKSEFMSKVTGAVLELSLEMPLPEVELHHRAGQLVQGQKIFIGEWPGQNGESPDPIISAVMHIAKIVMDPTLIGLLTAQDERECAWEYYQEKSKQQASRRGEDPRERVRRQMTGG